MRNTNRKQTPAAQEPPVVKNIDDVMVDFVEFLNRLIERGEKARADFRAKLDGNVFYSYLFASEVLPLARLEVVERECRVMLAYLQNPAIEDSLLEKLNNVSQQIDRRRKDFRVVIEHSTNAVANEIENAELEAMHRFYFSPNEISDSHFIQEYCREAVSVI